MTVELTQHSVGVIGCGNMGSAIVEAAVEHGVIDPSKLLLLDKAPGRASALASASGGRVAASLDELVEEAEILILAVKPQDAQLVLGSVAQWPSSEKALISIVAGITVSGLAEYLPPTVHIIRAMPNTPALVGAGVTAVLAPTSETLAIAQALFASCGAVIVAEKEAWFDPITALSGSGPAYIFVAIEALADGGVRMGLPRAVAQELAVRTVHGAAALVMATGKHPGQLKDAVASPGGTTIHGLAQLEKAGFRSALIEAVTAATERGQQLGAKTRST